VLKPDIIYIELAFLFLVVWYCCYQSSFRL